MADPFFADPIQRANIWANTHPGAAGTPWGPAAIWQQAQRDLREAPPTWDSILKGQMKQGRTPVDFATANQDQDRAAQNQYIQALHQQAQGDMNSYGQQQLRAGTQMAQGQAAGSAAARGNFGGAGAGMRFAGAAQNAIGRQGQDAAQVLKLQEQQAAQALLAQMYAQQHGQDVGLANGLAQTNMQNFGMDSAYLRGLSQIGQQGAMNDQQLAIDRMNTNLGIFNGQDKINAGWRDMAMGAAGAGAATAFNAFGGGGSGFRKVDGQNSIVPEWDK